MADTVKELVNKVQGMVPGIDSEIKATGDGALNVLIVGNPQQNLFGVVNELIGNLDPLDYPMMSGYRGTLVWGESTTVFRTDTWEPVATNLDAVAEQLKKYNKNSVQHRFTVTLNVPLLKGCNIHVLASDSDFEDVNWNAELSNCDYVLFTMSSTALLSMAERKAIRNWLAPHAADSYAVVLTKDNLILEDDRRDIDESLRSAFHGKVAIYRTPETDAQRLRDALSDMKDRTAALHEERNKRAEKLLLVAAKEAVEMQIRVYSENSASIEEATGAIRESVRRLPARQQAACRHARIQFIAPAKLDTVRAVNDFTQELNEKLREEIAQGDDPKEMSEILPSYIADAWRGKTEDLLDDIQVNTAAMQKELQLYIEKDIRNYIEGCVGGDRADYVYALTERYFRITDTFTIDDGDNRFIYDAPKDNTRTKYYGVIASGIALVLFSHPLIGIAVATLGSRKIKKDSRQQMAQDEKRSLAEACDNLNSEYKSDVLGWVDSVYDAVEKNIAASVEECYQKMIDSIVQALNKRKTDENDYKEKLSELRALKEEIDRKLAVES